MNAEEAIRRLAQDYHPEGHHHPGQEQSARVETLRLELEAGPHLLDLLDALRPAGTLGARQHSHPEHSSHHEQHHPQHGLTDAQAAHLLGRLKHLRHLVTTARSIQP